MQQANQRVTVEQKQFIDRAIKIENEARRILRTPPETNVSDRERSTTDPLRTAMINPFEDRFSSDEEWLPESPAIRSVGETVPPGPQVGGDPASGGTARRDDGAEPAPSGATTPLPVASTTGGLWQTKLLVSPQSPSASQGNFPTGAGGDTGSGADESLFSPFQGHVDRLRLFIFPNTSQATREARASQAERGTEWAGSGSGSLSSYNELSNDWMPVISAARLDSDHDFEDEEEPRSCPARFVGAVSDLICEVGRTFRPAPGLGAKMKDSLELLTGQAPMATTGFVTFKTLAAATAAAQLRLSHKANVLLTKPAPEPRDIVWENVSNVQQHSSMAQLTASLILNVGAFMFGLLIASLAVLSDPGWLYHEDPDGDLVQNRFIKWLHWSDDRITAIVALLPAAGGLGLLMLVPWVFLFVALKYEGIKSKIDVELSVFFRFQTYYVAYLFITTFSIAVTSVVLQVLEDGNLTSFSTFVETLALAVPRTGGYFITVLILKTFFGLTWELARPWALLTKSVSVCFRPLHTMGETRLADSTRPDPFRFGWIFPSLVLSMAIVQIYQIITPLLAPFAFVYFSLAYLIYKHQALYVYVNDFESGGIFLPFLLTRTLQCMIWAQALLALFLLFKEQFIGSMLMVPLVCLSTFAESHLRHVYMPLVEHLPFDIAVHVDQIFAGKGSGGGEEPRGEDGASGAPADPEAPPSAAGRWGGFEGFDVSQFFVASMYMQPELKARPLHPHWRNIPGSALDELDKSAALLGPAVAAGFGAGPTDPTARARTHTDSVTGGASRAGDSSLALRPLGSSLSASPGPRAELIHAALHSEGTQSSSLSDFDAAWANVDRIEEEERQQGIRLSNASVRALLPEQHHGQAFQVPDLVGLGLPHPTDRDTNDPEGRAAKFRQI